MKRSRRAAAKAADMAIANNLSTLDADNGGTKNTSDGISRKRKKATPTHKNDDASASAAGDVADGLLLLAFSKGKGAGKASNSKSKPKQSTKRAATGATTDAKKSSTAKSKSSHHQHDLHPLVHNDDITRVKTGKSCAHRWDALINMARSSSQSIVNQSRSSNSNNNDPFDCADLTIPPPYELINREVERGKVQWNDLASRVVIDEEEDDTMLQEGDADGDKQEKASSDHNGHVPLRNHELLLDAAPRGDRRQQRLLPYNFDYTCKRKNTPSSDNNDTISAASTVGGGQHHHHCPKVISLVDPTQTLDYEDELYHVFQNVKTSNELEELYALGSGPQTQKKKNSNDGSSSNSSKTVRDDSSGEKRGTTSQAIAHGCQHTFEVKNNLKEWFAKYTRLDAHSLGRLRIRERHSYPARDAWSAALSSLQPLSTNGVASSSANHSDATKDGRTNHQSTSTSSSLQSTIRFEILRHSHNLKRGSGSDSNRLEVELHGRQHTLLDLHQLLVESTNSLKNGGMKKSDCNENGDNNEDDIICAGVFFIENTVYTCGNVGDQVGEIIQHWLDGKETAVSERTKCEGHEIAAANRAGSMTPRRQYLGLSPNTTTIQMSEMNVEDLHLRLGIRYFHMFVPPSAPLHLRPNNIWSIANESAVYVTGIHTYEGLHNTANQKGEQEDATHQTKPPIIIHDTWAPPQRHICLACNYSMALVVTVNDPLADTTPPSLDVESNKVHLQGVPMCSSCYQALHYKQNSQKGGADEGSGSQPMLELKASHQPSLVLSIEEYQRLVTASSLDEVSKSLTL